MTSKAAIVLLLLVAASGTAQTPTAGEYQVKAAFLLNFVKFVEWPAGSFKSPNDAIHICVLGASPFGRALSDVLAGQKIGERPLLDMYLVDVREAGVCQILFVSKSERSKLRNILAAVAGNGVLTVGESDKFAPDGGMIGFRLDDGKVHLEINVKAAEHAHVQISSKLVRLARTVGE